MLRSLLADRFKLQVTHDTRIEPEYALVVAKGGPKLAPTAWVAPDPNAPRPEKPDPNGAHLNLSHGKISAVNQPVSGLCDLLTAFPKIEGHLVVDQTGIQGRDDYTVLFSSGASDKNIGEVTGVAPPTDDSKPSIFTALEEQLGLRLENTKGPVDRVKWRWSPMGKRWLPVLATQEPKQAYDASPVRPQSSIVCSILCRPISLRQGPVQP